MAKIKINSDLLARAKKVSEAAGYSSVEEFIQHVIETKIAEHEGDDQAEDKVADQLRGLGYID